MTKIVERARIAKAADGLWLDIGPFGAVGQWHPLLSKVDSEGEREGSLRVAEGHTAAGKTNGFSSEIRPTFLSLPDGSNGYACAGLQRRTAG